MGFVKVKLHDKGTIYINPEYISRLIDTYDYISKGTEPGLDGTCLIWMDGDAKTPFVVDATANEIVEVAAKIAGRGTFLTGGF